MKADRSPADPQRPLQRFSEWVGVKPTRWLIFNWLLNNRIKISKARTEFRLRPRWRHGP